MDQERMKNQINSFCCSVVTFGGLDIQFALNYLEDVSDYPADTLSDELENYKDSIGAEDFDMDKIDIGYIAVDYVFQNARNKIDEIMNIDIENDLGFYTYGNYLDSSIDRKDENLKTLQIAYNKLSLDDRHLLGDDKFFLKFSDDVGLETIDNKQN